MTSLAVFLSGATLVTSRPVIENPYTSSGSTMKAGRRRLPLEHSAARLLGFLFTGFGFVILGGGPGRFPPPTYQPLLDLTGGSVWPYALLYLTSGLLLLFGRTIVTRMTGAGLGILANSAFAALFLVAVLTFPTAGSTAWWAYAGFATQSAVLAGLLWTEHTSSRREPGRHGDE